MSSDGSAEDDSLADDSRERPTLPVPRPSPVRIALVRVAYGSARVDIVVADLARDPRSEICYERRSGPAVTKSGSVPRIPVLRRYSGR